MKKITQGLVVALFCLFLTACGSSGCCGTSTIDYAYVDYSYNAGSSNCCCGSGK